MSTISELFAQRKEGEELRLWNPAIMGPKEYFIPIFHEVPENRWVGLDPSGYMRTRRDDEQNWTLWTTPKKKVRRFLWDLKWSKGTRWSLHDVWLTEDEASLAFKTMHEYRKSAVCVDGREDEE